MRVKTGRGLSREPVTHQRSGLLRELTARRVRDAQPSKHGRGSGQKPLQLAGQN